MKNEPCKYINSSGKYLMVICTAYISNYIYLWTYAILLQNGITLKLIPFWKALIQIILWAKQQFQKYININSYGLHQNLKMRIPDIFKQVGYFTLPLYESTYIHQTKYYNDCKYIMFFPDFYISPTDMFRKF